MSYIVTLLKQEYLNKVKTTKDLIYKDKIIDSHNIVSSYEKLVKEHEFFWKSKIKLGNNHYYYNDTIKIVFKIGALNVNLTSKMPKNKSVQNFILSEIQNSLWIEGVRSSKKQIKQFLKPEAFNSQDSNYLKMLVTNYRNALHFISTPPHYINEKTFFVLYNILTKGMDMKENTLDGFLYREDQVEIGDPNIKGIDPSLIKNSMDKMFDFVKNQHDQKLIAKNVNWIDQQFHYLNAILLHLNFEHIHPYYDMNGRMGRLLSVWYLTKYNLAPHILYLSEAVNIFKKDLYYQAFKKIRINSFKFDATYFVGSILTAIVAHKVCYLVMKSLENQVKKLFKTKFNSLQKDIVMNLLSKKKDTFYKKEDLILGVEFINPAQVSKSFQELVSWKIIDEINSKPKEYSLIWNDEITSQMKKLIISSD